MINTGMLKLAVSLQLLKGHLVGKDRGATAVEYGLIVALIAVAIITGVTLLGGTIGSMFTHTANKVSSARTVAPPRSSTASSSLSSRSRSSVA